MTTNTMTNVLTSTLEQKKQELSIVYSQQHDLQKKYYSKLLEAINPLFEGVSCKIECWNESVRFIMPDETGYEKEVFYIYNISSDVNTMYINYYTTQCQSDFEINRLINLGKVVSIFKDTKQKICDIYNEVKLIFKDVKNELYRLEYSLKDEIKQIETTINNIVDANIINQLKNGVVFDKEIKYYKPNDRYGTHITSVKIVKDKSGKLQKYTVNLLTVGDYEITAKLTETEILCFVKQTTFK